MQRQLNSHGGVCVFQNGSSLRRITLLRAPWVVRASLRAMYRKYGKRSRRTGFIDTSRCPTAWAIATFCRSTRSKRRVLARFVRRLRAFHSSSSIPGGGSLADDTSSGAQPRRERTSFKRALAEA